MFTSFLSGVASVLLASVSSSGLPGTSLGDSPDHGELDRILRDTVRDERVDYLALRRDHLARLEAYLEAMAAVDPDALARDDSLAFHLNLYNATMLHAVVRRFRAGYTVADSGFGIFDEPLVRLDGRRVSLNQLENEVIRPHFQEPRVHVALVCAARSCPPLIPRAYRGEDLDAVLTANLQRFVRDRSRNQVDREARTARLSQIFHWYADDFGGKDRVLEFFDRHHPDDLATYQLGEPLEYDWSLNLAPPRGQWVQVNASAAPLLGEPGGSETATAAAGEVFEVLGQQGEWWQVRRPFGAGVAWLARARTGEFR